MPSQTPEMISVLRFICGVGRGIFGRKIRPVAIGSTPGGKNCSCDDCVSFVLRNEPTGHEPTEGSATSRNYTDQIDVGSCGSR